MEGHSLHESYTICGRTFEIYAKTGRFKKGVEGYKFYREDGNKISSFDVTGVNLREEIELLPEDCVSIAKFNNGPLFLVFNHRNSKYKYYRNGVSDLWWWLREEKNGLIMKVINEIRFPIAVWTFADTKTYSNVLEKLRSEESC